MSSYVDAHVHLTQPEALQDLIRAGIAGVRDAGSKQAVNLSLARLSAAGGAPRILSAGRALAKRGGYGAFLGRAVETKQEIAGEIELLVKEGAAIIKVIASGVVSLEKPGILTDGGFGYDDLRFIVDEAGTYRLPVMAHANGEAAILNAARAGVRSVEHGFFMTDAALRSLAEKKVYWVPTIGALKRAGDRAEVGPAVAIFIGQEIDRHLAKLGRAFNAGVPLAVGTDCVLPDENYGSRYDDELAFFRKAGIAADDVERIAGTGGAELLGI